MLRQGNSSKTFTASAEAVRFSPCFSLAKIEGSEKGQACVHVQRKEEARKIAGSSGSSPPGCAPVILSLVFPPSSMGSDFCPLAEIFSTIIALPLLHPLDCNAGLLFQSRQHRACVEHSGSREAPHVEVTWFDSLACMRGESLRKATCHIAPSACAPCCPVNQCLQVKLAVRSEDSDLYLPAIEQGYRLCCKFSESGLVNLVSDLLNDDKSSHQDKSLCGWIYVGCGSGKQLADSKAREMFRVLCAAMARVLCLHKDKHESDTICSELIQRLQGCIGIVSLRDVLQIGERGEFLQHETYCLGSRFQDSDVHDEVRSMVNQCFTTKGRRMQGTYESSPEIPPFPQESSRTSVIISISDDERENSPAKTCAHTVPKPAENGSPEACGGTHQHTELLPSMNIVDPHSISQTEESGGIQRLTEAAHNEDHPEDAVLRPHHPSDDQADVKILEGSVLPRSDYEGPREAEGFDTLLQVSFLIYCLCSWLAKPLSRGRLASAGLSLIRRQPSRICTAPPPKKKDCEG